jgi:hypothetical protein
MNHPSPTAITNTAITATNITEKSIPPSKKTVTELEKDSASVKQKDFEKDSASVKQKDFEKDSASVKQISTITFYGLTIDHIQQTPPNPAASKCALCSCVPIFEFQKGFYCFQHTYDRVAFEAVEVIIGGSVRHWSITTAGSINPDPPTLHQMATALAAMVNATKTWTTCHRDLRTGSASTTSVTFKVPDDVKLDPGDLWMPIDIAGVESTMGVESMITTRSGTKGLLCKASPLSKLGADDRIQFYVQWQLKELLKHYFRTYVC